MAVAQCAPADLCSHTEGFEIRGVLPKWLWVEARDHWQPRTAQTVDRDRWAVAVERCASARLCSHTEGIEVRGVLPK